MTNRYKVILADPPWHFKTYSAKGTGRSAVSFYDVMDAHSLKRLPVQEYAEKDCALFMWAIDPMLPQAIELMENWGFRFKTVAFTWVKLNKRGREKKVEDDPFFTGLGYWTRANPEICILGTCGKPTRKARDVRRLITAERREHSRKPDEIYPRIERLIEGPYLELFARQRRPGWDAIGDQLNADEMEQFTRRQPSNLVRHAPCERAEQLF